MSGIHIHATNIAGTGAIQLFGSLFPELNRTGEVRQVYVSPEAEAIARREDIDLKRVHRVERRLPKFISRVLECTLFARQFKSGGVLLVLGDIPLAGVRPQVVLVHSPYLIERARVTKPSEWKYIVSRALFRLNTRHVAAFVVQSQVMQKRLETSFPGIRGRVHIIPQPPPQWVLAVKGPQARTIPKEGLNLFYPSAAYGHKNHKLLRGLKTDAELRNALKQITVTISAEDCSGIQSDFVNCVGHQGELGMIGQYCTADALLFLSKKESFGFPLLEAMWLGLPIICPDLPYARWMCGDEAVYFDPESSVSLRKAIFKMHNRLISGWRPDWSKQLTKIPPSWTDCTNQFLKLCDLSRDLSKP